MLTLSITLFVIGVYFMPAMCAYFNHKRARTGIFLLNLLLGWTALGWIIALIWASIPDAKVS